MRLRLIITSVAGASCDHHSQKTSRSAIIRLSTKVEPVTQPPVDRTAKKRASVRRHRRERQILVFGLILVGMGLAGVFFASVYRGDVEGPFSEAFVTPASAFETEVNDACPPSGALPLPATEIALRVMNSTDTAGLAGTAATDLRGRGFVVTDASNWNRSFDGAVRIYYGELGLVQAYTLATYFTESEIILDTRDSPVLDLILGDDYSADTLLPQDAPELNPETPLPRPQQCVPVELVVPEPAPRTIPDDPFASAEPSVTPSPEPSDS